MSRVLILRLKAFVADYGPLLALTLALLGATMVGYAGWVHTNPPTTEVTDRVDEQTFRSELHTAATTSADTSMYDPGTRLVDQPVYLRSAVSSIALTQRAALPTDQPVHVEQRLVLRYQVRHDGATFWEESHVLARNETTTATGAFVSNASLDVGDVRSRVGEIRADAGDAGTVRTQLVVTLAYESERHAGELSETVPLRVTGSTVSIDRPVLERAHGTTVTSRQPVPRRSTVYLVPGGAGVALLAAAGLVALRFRRGFDRRDIERRLQARRFTEWISSGSVPDSSGRTTVSLDSLADLVDVAIDTDNRVVHDEKRNVYVVLDDTVLYRYCPETVRSGASA